MTQNVFHAGELTAQQLAGEADLAGKLKAMIGNQIPLKAFEFIHEQPLAALGSMDKDGGVWASVLCGQPGFLQVLNAQTLRLDLSDARLPSADPFWDNAEHHPHIGLLIIDLATRRRLRVNGVVRRLAPYRFEVDVVQCYANCPKYIQRRSCSFPTEQTVLSERSGTRGSDLNPAQWQIISAADTLFVASAHPVYGLDASHRGGHPGFVYKVGENTLRVPDYRGNSMFNTLGNFTSYPHAGLVFIDFVHNRVLQLSGRVEITWRPGVTEESSGIKRFWDLKVDAWMEFDLPYRAEWILLERSPFLPTK